MTPNGRAGAAGKKKSQKYVDLLKKNKFLNLNLSSKIKISIYLLLRLKKGLMEGLLILII